MNGDDTVVCHLCDPPKPTSVAMFTTHLVREHNWTSEDIERLANAPVIDRTQRSGIELIAAERKRQIDHGWSEEHDEMHDRAELAYAAVVYATPPGERIGRTGWLEDWWPFPEIRPDMHNDSPTVAERRDEMVRAGAFCAAEVDRLTRKIETGD